MTNELTTTESTRLEACEQVITSGLQTFTEVGNALLEIRDSRLYRASHKTFEAYCQQRWNMSRPQAYRVIQAADVAKDLSPIGDKPINEAQARELAKVPQDERQAVMEAAQASGGKITAAVDAAQKTHPEAYRAWLRAGGGSL